MNFLCAFSVPSCLCGRKNIGKYFLFFVVTVSLFSCQQPQGATDAQNKKFNDLKKTIIEHKNIFLNTPDSIMKTDSLKMMLDDIENYNLDQFTTKYQLAGKDIDNLLDYLSTAAKILRETATADSIIDQGLKDVSKFDDSISKLNIDSFDFKLKKIPLDSNR
jgi:hypothetical protein